MRQIYHFGAEWRPLLWRNKSYSQSNKQSKWRPVFPYHLRKTNFIGGSTMARKGENIFKRKDGRWEARYIKGHEFSGKIKYGFCYGKTYREAKDKVTLAKMALLGQVTKPVCRDRRLFFCFCDEWIALRRGEVRESTYVKYNTILEKHIKPKLGKYFPLALTTKTIDDFKWDLLDVDDLAPKTVKDILLILRAVLNYTAKQFPGLFPILEFHYPRIDRKEIRVLSPDEQWRLTSYLLSEMDDCRFGILLALMTGMRLGELCALKWENVSVRERTIKINETMQRLKNMDKDAETKTRLWVGNPKSNTSCRVIPMTESVAGLCGRMPQYSPASYILTGTTEPMEPRTLQYRLEKYTHECGIEQVHFHTLRHSFATRCVEAGFELKSLSEILGHANSSITLELYVHSSLELKRTNMNKLSLLNL